MSFDEELRDPWRDDGPNWSKGFFLRTAVECGAAFIGYLDGVECPYYGAHLHAEELEAEGLLVKIYEGWPQSGCSIWIPTMAGRVVGGSS